MPHLNLAGVFTHFSSAESDPDFIRHQRKLFLTTLKGLPGLDQKELLIHADNSAALDSLSPNSPFNAVRVGILQFGIRPYSESLFGKISVEPIFSLHARVGLINDLPAGTGIGYDRTNIIARNTKVAIITAGYGDALIGRQGVNSIEITEFSNWAKQIPWEILCSVTKRVPRVYTTDSAH